MFYSFSKTLGGNMFGLVTYYLLSPFNLIFMLFDKDINIDELEKKYLTKGTYIEIIGKNILGAICPQ